MQKIMMESTDIPMQIFLTGVEVKVHVYVPAVACICTNPSLLFVTGISLPSLYT